MSFRRPGRLLLTLAFIMTTVLAAPLAAQEATPGAEIGGVTIVSPDESYAGATLGEWNARSWQWSVSVPAAVNPSFSPDGTGCEIGQFGPVFFIPGSYTEEPVSIPCIVPEGTALFVTVGGAECSTVEPPPFFGRDEAELRACAEAATNSASSLEASINGEAVPNVEQYRSSSPVFSLNLPEDNIFGVPAGVALSVADGYAFIVAPPPPGAYEITGTVTFDDGSTLTGSALITVVAPQIIEPESEPASGTPEATPAS